MLAVSLSLAVVVVLPDERPLVLEAAEDQAAEKLLNAGADLAEGVGITATEEIWVARDREEAIHQMAWDLSASAVVLGWASELPHFFDFGGAIHGGVPCPVVMVGQPADAGASPDWPPRWLAEIQFQPLD